MEGWFQMDLWIVNLITLLNACVWWRVGVGTIAWSWGGEHLGEEKRNIDPEKEPGVSNLGVWLCRDVINQYMKNKRWKSRFGEEASEFSFGCAGYTYVGFTYEL